MILLHKHLAVSAKEGMQIKSVKNKKRKTIRLPFYKSNEFKLNSLIK